MTLEEEIKNKFEQKVGSLKFFKTCSRKTIGSTVSVGFGINEVLPVWLEESPFFREKKDYKIKNKNVREFLKFGGNE